MVMVAGGYSIEELAEETGFDKRVIRSFVEQGLLRGPHTKGRYARYTEAHLVRLQAIRELKDSQQMNLSEIRTALLSMTEEDIQALSQKCTADRQGGLLQKSSVLDYLRSARQSSGSASLPASETPQAARRLSAVDRLLSVLQEDSGPDQQLPHARAQLWHRFAVTPDIELTVRGLQDGGQVEQWERIADCLREILLGGTRHE
jgi:DNA-binding transcriptional MerR regulator